jgi:ABC-type multidrug transport system ATPase subunit
MTERARAVANEGRRPIEKIELEGLGRTYGGTTVLRGVTACFRAGEVVSIEGANGSGKTTLLGIIGTLVRPTVGRVSYDPQRSLEDIRRELGWVSHESLAYPDLTARQNVELAASLYEVDPAQSWRELSERLQLGPFENRPVRQQSRGQRQRVAVARALVHHPSALLLDEPTTGLDTLGVEQLRAVIHDEAREGTLVIFVTHDAQLASELCTRRLRLERGALAELPSSR